MRDQSSVPGRTIAQTKAHIDYFKQYKPETERTIGKFEVTKDEALENLKKAFRKLKYSWDDNTYRQAIELVKNLSYSSKDITAFSIALSEFQDEEHFRDRAGLFLGALINICKDREFTIVMEHLEKSIDCLGYENTKLIIVQGNAGDYVGKEMNGGIITVKGNAGGWVGLDMNDGTIIVKGNAGGRVGKDMRGGTIIVKGNAGDKVGFWMQGGTIHLEGEFRSLGKEFYGGDIYHKGKLIVKDGVKVK